MIKALILLSGGIDSTVVLAMALEKKRNCIALSFDYGQRHQIELTHAKNIAAHYTVPHKVISIEPACFSSSALVSDGSIPINRTREEMARDEIPSTYVPARNTLFLAYATGQAEILRAEEIYAGANLLDRNPYPDCRPEFYQAFQKVIDVATKQSVTGVPPTLMTPLIDWDKIQIVREGLRLRAPLELTFSCYNPQDKIFPCQQCDACILRAEAVQLGKSNLQTP